MLKKQLMFAPWYLKMVFKACSTLTDINCPESGSVKNYTI